MIFIELYSDFMSVFLGWVKMYIEDQDHSLAMLDFVEWFSVK